MAEYLGLGQCELGSFSKELGAGSTKMFNHAAMVANSALIGEPNRLMKSMWPNEPTFLLASDVA